MPANPRYLLGDPKMAGLNELGYAGVDGRH